MSNDENVSVKVDPNIKNKEKLAELKKIYSDLEETEQYDPNCSILRIKYNEIDNYINSIFRTTLVKKEISKRVYDLTTLILEISATNYMGWLIRRICIDELNMKEDYIWLNNQTKLNQKCYQIWNHRKILVEKFGDWKTELEVMNEIFIEESKNYHAWCHRIWVTRRFNLYSQEFNFVNRMIEFDARNNSAWNYKIFLIKYVMKFMKNKENFENNDCISKDENKIIFDEILKISKNFNIDIEIKYAFSHLNGDYNNESIYSYVKGLLDDTEINYLNYDNNLIIEKLKEIRNLSKMNYHSTSLLLELLIENEDKKHDNKVYDFIIELLDELAEVDYIRKKYWKWRKNNFIKQIKI